MISLAENQARATRIPFRGWSFEPVFQPFLIHFSTQLSKWAEISYCQDVVSLMSVCRIQRNGIPERQVVEHLLQDILTYEALSTYEPAFIKTVLMDFDQALSLIDGNVYVWIAQRFDGVFSVGFEFITPSKEWTESLNRCIPEQFHAQYIGLIRYFAPLSAPLSLVYLVDDCAPAAPDLYGYFQIKNFDAIENLLSGKGLQRWESLLRNQYNCLTKFDEPVYGFVRINHQNPNCLGIYWAINCPCIADAMMAYAPAIPNEFPGGHLNMMSNVITPSTHQVKLYFRKLQAS